MEVKKCPRCKDKKSYVKAGIFKRKNGKKVQRYWVLSVHEWDQWKTDNPDWDRDWSDPSTCPGSGEVGEWRDKHINKNPGWGEVLKKASKAGGSKSRI